KVRAVNHGNAAAPPRGVHAVAANGRRAMQRDGLLVRSRGAEIAVAVFCLHPWQPELTDHLGLERIGDVERPDHAAVPARRVVRQHRKLALVVDAEAVRPGARQIVEADLLRLAALADVEDEQAGAGVTPGFAAEP